MKLGVAFLAGFLLLPVFAVADHSININTADKATLMLLSGIGEVKAQAIIEYRSANGPFQSVVDVMNVKGIGEATYNNIKDHIVLQGGVSSAPSPSPAPPSPPSTPSASPAPPPPSYVPPPEQSVYADAGADRDVTLGADAEFNGRAYGKNNETLRGLIRYSWNFGDGSTAEGQAVLHRFSNPGRYAVTLRVSQETESAQDTIVIQAKSAQLILTALSSGAISIENASGRDVDVSRWILRASGKEFSFSPWTVILAASTITLSQENTGLPGNANAELLYPNGTLGFRAGFEQKISESTAAPSPPPTSTPAPKNARSVAPEREVAAEERAVEDSNEYPIVENARDVSNEIQTAAANAAGGSWMWWLGALAITLGGAGSVYASRRFARREWNIIDE